MRLNSISSPISCKVNNVFIQVSDLKKSAEWYGNLLGLPFDSDQVESPVYNIPVTAETGLTLDDHSFEKDFKLHPSAHVLFNFFVADIHEAYDFIKKNDIKVVKEIEQIGDFAYFNFQDLDGNVLMICNC
ncbi:VOC family protein [Bacillus sp. JJ1609]|uniref:VOC family protein n=1 Tax=Bacillus sp. JJ1609 TaxID=3122977 RepID=UPI002FFFFBAD